MSKPSLAVALALILVALVALGGLQMVAQASQGPEQPVGFTHMTHAGVLQMDCTFCHRNVTKGSNASVPSVQQCMFCHSVINGSTDDKMEEIDKVQAAMASGSPIDWMRVHRLPDHVRFVHEAHITAGVSCLQCHGDVAGTTRVAQIRGMDNPDPNSKIKGNGGSLKMGDCVSCHRVNNAPTDCITCHK